jgi:hypothetical protein
LCDVHVSSLVFCSGAIVGYQCAKVQQETVVYIGNRSSSMILAAINADMLDQP